jgi:hypothetical protein
VLAQIRDQARVARSARKQVEARRQLDMVLNRDSGNADDNRDEGVQAIGAETPPGQDRVPGGSDAPARL